jgi:uncharacterized protein YndB with AHSA1/START domain
MSEPITAVQPVVREVVVQAPIDTCFRTFVDAFGAWWPPEHHIGDREVTEFRIEPFVGGRCYDVDTEGGVCHWATVLTYEPPSHLVLAWHIQGDWTIDLDATRQSEIDISFAALDDERTVVRLEHGHLERHGDGVSGLQAGITGAGGWTGLLDRFKDVTEGRPPQAIPTGS